MESPQDAQEPAGERRAAEPGASGVWVSGPCRNMFEEERVSSPGILEIAAA